MDTQPERDLWQAILSTAARDAAYQGSYPYLRLRSVEAKEWFSHPASNFRKVCQLLKLDENEVRAHALADYQAPTGAVLMAVRRRARKIAPRVRHAPELEFLETV
jgi:hypothetical protein